MLKNRLKDIRSALKISSAKKFAEKLNIAEYIVKDLESGKTQTIKPEIAEKIEDIFFVNGWWLLTGKGEMFLKEEKSLTKKDALMDGYEIDVLNVKAGAGEGVYNYEIEVIDKIVMDKAFFKSIPDPSKMKIIEVDGDSMYPTLQAGDHVIIDETKTNGIDGIYALQLHNQILIKRLQFNLDGTIEIKSDNQSYNTQIYNPKETQVPLHIIGMKTLTIQR